MQTNAIFTDQYLSRRTRQRSLGFGNKMDHSMKVKRPDLVLINKKGSTCPSDDRMKVKRKLDKY